MKLAVIRSCYHDAFNHSPAQYVLTTGQSRLGFPSVGAWVTHGLGSVSENLPAMVVLTEPDGKLKGGTPCWAMGFCRRFIRARRPGRRARRFFI
jgi:hypothetical protein